MLSVQFSPPVASKKISRISRSVRGNATSAVAAAVAESYVAETFVDPNATDMTTPAVSTVAIAVSALSHVTSGASTVSPAASITIAEKVPITPIVSSVSQWGSITIRVPSWFAPMEAAVGRSSLPGAVGMSSTQASRTSTARSAPARPAHPSIERHGHNRVRAETQRGRCLFTGGISWVRKCYEPIDISAILVHRRDLMGA